MTTARRRLDVYGASQKRRSHRHSGGPAPHAPGIYRSFLQSGWFFFGAFRLYPGGQLKSIEWLQKHRKKLPQSLWGAERFTGGGALRAAQLSPKIHSQPPTEHKNPACDAETPADRNGSASKTASPHPLKSPMLRRKAGDDGGVQRTPSARQTPKQSTAKYQKMNKELLP